MPASPAAPSAPMDVVAPPTSTIAPSTPSSPSAPAKGPSTPTGQSSKSESGTMDNAFSDLDSLVELKPQKPVPTTKIPAKTDDAEPKDELEAKVEPEVEKPEAQKAPEVKTDKQPSKPATLRAAYENTKRENYELKQQIEQLKQAKPIQEDPQLKTYRERLEAAERRREELESEIRYSAYERSPEYQEKYQKPFEEAYQWGRQSVARLKVNLEDGQSRPATPDDFDKIMLIPDDGDAIDAAEAMFGNKAKIVLDHRWEMKKLDAARYRAIEDFKKSGTERQQKMMEAEVKQREFKGQLWAHLNQVAAERFPQWFKPEEGDAEGNQLLEEGYALADAAFSGENGKPPEEIVKLHASIRNRAAAFTREVYRNKKLTERVSELEKQLADYQESEPGPGEGGGPTTEADSWESQLDKLAS